MKGISFLVFAACLSHGTASAPTIIHLDLGVEMNCAALPMKYCLAELGCQPSSGSHVACVQAKDAPAVNCSEQVAKVDRDPISVPHGTR